MFLQKTFMGEYFMELYEMKKLLSTKKLKKMLKGLSKEGFIELKKVDEYKYLSFVNIMKDGNRIFKTENYEVKNKTYNASKYFYNGLEVIFLQSMKLYRKSDFAYADALYIFGKKL